MKKIRILLLRRWYMVGGAALLAAAAVFYAVNYPAAVSTAATTRQLPIYSVERAQKVCAISFDAAWGEGKVRHGCREREQDRAINAWGIRLSSLNTHQGKAAKSPCRRFCSFLVFYYHRSTRADTVLTGRNAPILRQVPWQYGKYSLRVFSCLDVFLHRQNCSHLPAMYFRVIFGF